MAISENLTMPLKIAAVENHESHVMNTGEVLDLIMLWDLKMWLK